MAKKDKAGSDNVRMEVETARRVVEAAQKNLATLERSLKTIRQREKQASRKMGALQKRAIKEPSLLKTKAYAAAKDSLKAIATAKRRNERLVARQRKSVAEQIRRLRALEQQARRLDRDLQTFYRRAEAQAAAASGDTMTGQQLRAARAMLNRGLTPFAKALGISVAKLKRFEGTDGPIVEDADRLKQMGGALHDLGVELIGAGMYVGNGGPGIRVRSGRAVAPKAGTRKKVWTRKKRRQSRAKAVA